MRARLAGGLMLIAALLPLVGARPAAADDALVGYTLHATAPGIELVYDSTQLPAPSHPLFTGTLPEATADLETGPSGRGFSSLLWPGALAGNLGTTVQQLNQLCPPGQLAAIPVIGPQLQCLPVTDQEKLLLAGANDPVRAEARSPSGPSSATYGAPGALFMSARAAGADVSADSGVGALNGLPLLGLGSVTSHAESVVDGPKATARAMSTITDLTIGENLPVPGLPVPAGVALLAVDSITSTAQSVSDGATGTPAGTLEIAGVRVLGMPATIDDTGLHLQGQTQGLGAALDPLRATAEKALSALHFQASAVAAPVLQHQGSAAGATVAGIVISFQTPDGASYQITAGKAVAGADASPSISIDLGGDLLDTGLLGSLSDVLPLSVGGVALPEFTAPSTVAASPAVNSPGVAIRAVLPAGTPIGPALALFALIVAAGLAAGLMRVSDTALQEAASGTACPNPRPEP